MIRDSLPILSNRESFAFEVEFIDPDDNTPIDLTGATMQVEVRRDGWFPWAWDYWPYYDQWPVSAPRLRATTTDGSITFQDNIGAIINFTEDQVRALPAGQYTVAGTLARDGKTIQAFLLNMPIVCGGVTQ